MEKKLIRDVEEAIPSFMRISRNMFIDYDEEADVLYVNFENPPRPDESDMEGENVIVNKRGNKIVGISILNASSFKAET